MRLAPVPGLMLVLTLGLVLGPMLGMLQPLQKARQRGQTAGGPSAS
jgi:hypothetical protein